MKVPFVDLKKQYNSIKPEIDSAIARVIEEGAFIGGKYAAAFEKEFGAWMDIQSVVGCANGTDSLEILMKAMGIGQGDEVIVPALSWFSTSESVSAVGAVPVFVDIEPDFYTIDVQLIEAKITSRTKAIIPVHLYGQTVDMKTIMSIAKKHGLKVIEDCAQSHGAELSGKKAGTWGHAASFSFYPGKNLGAYGDAGCMATDDGDLAKHCRMIANHGQLVKHDHQIEGRNSRLDGMHGAVLSVKLKHLNTWTQKRIQNADHYTKFLKNADLVIPKTRPDSKHVFHLYVVQVKDRKKVIEYLDQKGIQTAVHYPMALPFLKPYAGRNYSKNDFPVANAVCEKILSIPMFAEMEESEIEYVSTCLIEACNSVVGNNR